MKASRKLLGLAALCWVGLSLINVPRFSTWADEVEQPASSGPGSFVEEEVPADSAAEPEVEAAADSVAVRLQQAADLARQAEAMTQRAALAADWDAVVAQWLQAIALVQSVPPESPSRIVAQRQMRGYLDQLLAAQQRSEQASPSAGLPSLGSDVFNDQLAGYLSYVATVGTPDILIVGSSRALQGIDPQVMQQSLQRAGHELRVFNFSVNGATAQVINFLLSDLLPKPLPTVVVWGDGSRAFNDGRRDRTWESLTSSPGYQTIHAATLPATLPSETPIAPSVSLAASSATANRVSAQSPLPKPSEKFDALGFLAVGDRFIPQAYYQQFPQVNGRYDGAYASFHLYGAQTTALAALARSAKSQNSRLIFVNLPLSGSYLDAYRLYYEEQFQQFLQAESRALSFDVVDLLSQWRDKPALFADPSHLNQDGAAAIAAQLAQNPTVLSALGNQSTAEQPAAEQPTIEQPAAEQPAAEQPAAEQHTTEQPAAQPTSVGNDGPPAETPAQ